MSAIELIVLSAALIGSALYSGLETGVVSVNRLRLQHLVRRKIRGADIVQRFLEQPDHLLGTTLAGTNLCNVAISVVCASWATTHFGTHGLWMASVVTTIVLLVFGEYLPKAWFRGYPAYRVIPFAAFLRWSGRVFYPISMGVMHVARLLVPGAMRDDEKANPFITREELTFLTHEGEQTGTLSSAERRMMHGVLQLTQKTCEDIMIPRERMIVVSPGTPAEEVLDIARRKQVSRLPIYNEETRKFAGFVHIMDILIGNHREARTAKDYARPPQYVSGSMRVDQLLPRMRLSRQPLALVQDHREKVIGLIASEDILQEIVGRL